MIEQGHRARKKQATRLAISDVATRLFIAKGFDAVTVADVAAEAGVSVKTIFNYVATKEDLFFDRSEQVEDGPSALVRARHEGEPLLTAMERGAREFLAQAPARLLSVEVRQFLRTIDESASLQARVRVMLERAETRLEAALREAGSDDPRIVAAFVMALFRTLLAEARHGIDVERPAKVTRAAMLEISLRGFAILRAGMGP
jgi:AcrR family transcriptional regulator